LGLFPSDRQRDFGSDCNFFGETHIKLLLVSQKNLQDDQKMLYIKEINPKLRLLQKMERMVGFRNIAVHEYQTIDTRILDQILNNHLKDLEEFYSTVVRRYI
jgi:hypothetical protein